MAKEYDISFTWDSNIPTQGNIGIGTSNPTKNLDVFGDINITQNLYNNTNQVGLWYDKSNNNNITNFSSKIGIATSSPAFQLDVLGDIHANDLLISSDDRLKTEKNPENLGLEFIMSLAPKTYCYTDKPGKVKHGFIAQELLETDFVDLDDNGYYTLAILEMLSPIVKSIQTLSDQINQNYRLACDLV